MEENKEIMKLLNKKRNLKKKSNEEEKKNKIDLMTYMELKEKAKQSISSSKTLKDFKNSIKIFDVDEIINSNYLERVGAINNKKVFDEFLYFKYTLKYDERIRLMKKYQDEIKITYEQNNYNKNFVLIQEKKLEEVFLNLLRFIIEEKGINLKKLFEKFCNDFYVDTLNLNIPIIYGNDELFFAYIINTFYNFFILNKDYPKIKRNTPIDINEIKIKKRKTSMIKKIKKGEDISDKEDENKKIKEKIIDINLEFTKTEENKFIKKLTFIKPIIKKYISDEFQENFSFMLNLVKDKILRKKIKYFFFSFFELVQNLYLKLDNPLTYEEEQNLGEFFYENKSEKIEILKNMNEMFKIEFYYIDDKDDKPIDLENFEIKNLEYLIEIKGNKYRINFYNFILKKLMKDMVMVTNNNYEICLNNIENFSLQGNILYNRCYNDNNLYNLYINDINSTLTNSTLEELFYNIIPFQKYNYPFKKKKFIIQLNEIVLFLPFFNNKIHGLCLRNLGIIIINKNIFNSNNSNNIFREFYISLIRASFGKITYLHETNFHYLLKLCSSQDDQLSSKTPIKYYKNYEFKKNEKNNSKNYDGGDLGEALIFGEKVFELYTPGAEKIFSNNFWNQKNINFAKFGTNFIHLNNKNSKYKKELKNLSDFTKNLYDLGIEGIKRYNEEVDYNSIDNIGEISVRMRMADEGLINQNINIGEISVKFPRIGGDVIDHDFSVIPGINNNQQ